MVGARLVSAVLLTLALFCDRQELWIFCEEKPSGEFSPHSLANGLVALKRSCLQNQQPKSIRRMDRNRARDSVAQLGNSQLTEASRLDKLRALLSKGHPDRCALLVACVRGATQAAPFWAADMVDIRRDGSQHRSAPSRTDRGAASLYSIRSHRFLVQSVVRVAHGGAHLSGRIDVREVARLVAGARV